ncbi:MAG: peptide deformylase [Anaerolineaceae bacterium]|nr:peptide deformylase [Anaerolineaceae bacterium]
MSVLEIVTFPQSVLRLKAKPVKTFDKDFQTLVDDMLETMRQAPGVGLAAPQVGESIQLVVVEFGDEEDETVPKKVTVLVNPEIVKTSEEVVTDVEACLSVPDLAGEVERFEKITVKAQDRFGQHRKLTVNGWLARIFQHEIDHLNGVLFIDRSSNIFRPSPEEMELIRD